jgi:hypothetical protein
MAQPLGREVLTILVHPLLYCQAKSSKSQQHHVQSPDTKRAAFFSAVVIELVRSAADCKGSEGVVNGGEKNLAASCSQKLHMYIGVCSLYIVLPLFKWLSLLTEMLRSTGCAI